MKPRLLSFARYWLLFLVCSSCLHFGAGAQQTLTTINGWNAYVHLPDDYNSTSKSYPVIVFLPGLGEVGTNPAKLLVYGPAKFIAEGHNMQFTVNGVLEKPIVISLQPAAAWPSPVLLNNALNTIIANYRVDVERISVTGLSMGGSVWQHYVTTNTTYAGRPACMVVMSAPAPANPISNFSFFASAGGTWWGFEGTQDPRKMDSVRDAMNAVVPGSARYTKYVGGHCCWNTWYNPSWRENGENIYEWMLKQRRGFDGPNISPVADAGPNQQLNLPVSLITLNGSASHDPDGNIASYSWSKISGPLTLPLSNSNSASATVLGVTLIGEYKFRLQVTDNQGAASADTVTITVNPLAIPSNNAPVAFAGNDLQITLPNNSVVLNGSGTDGDGTISSYSWSKIAGPAPFTIVNPSNAATTINGLVAGTYRFRLQVTDDDGATDADTVQVIVNAAPNIPPSASAGNDQQITLPANSITLAGNGNDRDGSISSYSWSKIAGPASFIITNPGNSSTTVTSLVAGVYRFRLQVTDNSGASAADTVQVTVNAAANVPPVASAGNDQQITLPANSVTLAGTATDPDGSISSYSWSKIAGPASFIITNPGNSSTTVTGLVAGVYRFRLQVTDNSGASAADTIQVTVNAAVNIPPSASAGNDQQITLPVNSVTLAGTATDPDGSISSYSWSKIAGPASFIITNPGNSSTTVTGLVAGVYRFRLQVTDNSGASAADTIQVTVNAAVNIPPSASAGNDQQITLPVNSVTLAGTATDPDGSISSYSWSKIAGPASFIITNPGNSSTTVTGLVAGVYRFRLQVTDNSGASAADTIQVTVNAAVNIPPSASAGNDQQITLPVNSVTLAGTATDPDGSISSYSWSKIAGPASFIITNPGNSSTTVTGLVAGVYRFRLQVTDNSGASAADTIQVTVNAAANVPPVASAGNDQQITLPVNSVTLAGTATDPDGSISSYSWSKIAGPASFIITNPGNASTTVTGLVAGVYRFRLQVTDNSGASAADTIQVTVNAAANIPPVASAGNDREITLPDNSIVVAGTGTDADGYVTQYNWTKIAGPNSFVIVSQNSASTNITGLVAGTYRFRLQVTDNSGAIAADTVDIKVNPAPAPGNILPVAMAGNNLEITLPINSVVLNGSGVDSDGSIAAYDWSKIEGPASFTITEPASATTSVTGLTTGVYRFRLQVTDNAGGSSADTVSVTVHPAPPPPNVPPVANAGSDITITLPVNSVTLSGTGSDPDGTISTFSWTRIGGPAAYTITNGYSSSTMVTGLIAGVYQFRLLVTDNSGASAADTVQVFVNPAVNILPVANAGNDIVITLPQNSVTLSGSGTDIDGTITAYSWTKIAGPQAFNITNAATAITTVDGLAAGVYKFRLQVTDNAGGISADTVLVTVNSMRPAPNVPPVANAGQDLVITLPQHSVVLTGTGSDPDGIINAYQWTKIAGPSAFTLLNSTSSITTVSGLQEGVYRFRLQVTDNAGATAADTVQVTVNAPANSAPVANAGLDQQLVWPVNSTQLKGVSSDADGFVVTHHWRAINNIEHVAFDVPDSSETKVTFSREGEYQLEYEVTDNRGAKGKDTLTVVVSPIAASIVKLYPNPAIDLVNIRIDAVTPANKTVICVYDLAGRLVYKEAFMRNQRQLTRQLNVHSWKPGVYIVSVNVEINRTITSRLVVMDR